MQALILVGGEGTRLRPLTRTQPKPILPLVDRPFLRYMIEWLGHHGVDDIIMACGFLPDGIRAVLGDGGGQGPRLRYLTEPEPRGTAGAIKFAEDLLDERFLALNGDVLTDLDLTALINLHEEREARGTLALYPVADPSAYGLVRRNEDGEIKEFLEKPDPSEIDTDEISAGAYVLEREVLDLVAADQNVSIEREVFPQLVGNGLYARRLEGYWMDIGTPERYLEASWDILEARAKTDVSARVGADGIARSPGAEISDQADIGAPALIEDGCRVEADAVIGGHAVLGASCEVGRGATIVRSVLHEDCSVGDGARIRGAILASGVHVGAGAVINEGAVIGQGAQISDGAEVQADARIQPEERI